ncbi:hypothetical protein AB205_0048360, partial [Aquarana catesbeiana]
MLVSTQYPKQIVPEYYSPSQPLPLSENISAADEGPGLALLSGVLSAAGEKTGGLGSCRHAVGHLGQLPSIPGVYRWRLKSHPPSQEIHPLLVEGRVQQHSALLPALLLETPHHLLWLTAAGVGQRSWTLCPVASASAGLVSSFCGTVCCWNSLSLVLSPRCTNPCWGGEMAASPPCISEIHWERGTNTFSPRASETAAGVGQRSWTLCPVPALQLG